MLEFLRKHQYGLMLVVAILTIIAFVFLYDKNTYSQGAGAAKRGTAFSVYGKGYDASTLQRLDNYFILAQNLGMQDMVYGLRGTRVFDNSIPLDFPMNLMILRKKGRELGITPSNEEVKKELESLQVFSGDNGKYDPAVFTEMSKNLGDRNFQHTDLMQITRDKITLDRVKELLVANFTPPSTEVDDAYSDRNQEITAYALKRSLDEFLKTVEVTDEEIKERYEENKEELLSEEQRKIEYIHFKAPEFPKPAPAPRPTPGAGINLNGATGGVDPTSLLPLKKTPAPVAPAAPEPVEEEEAEVEESGGCDSPQDEAVVEDIEEAVAEAADAVEEAADEAKDLAEELVETLKAEAAEAPAAPAKTPPAAAGATAAPLAPAMTADEKKEIGRSFSTAVKESIDNAFESGDEVDLGALAKDYMKRAEGKMFGGEHETTELFTRESAPEFLKNAQGSSRTRTPLDIVFSVKNGELSRAEKLRIGDRDDWMLFRVLEVIEPKQLTLEEAKEKITEELKNEKATAAMNDALTADAEKIKAEMDGKKSFKEAADKLGIEYARHYKFIGQPQPMGTYMGYRDLVASTVAGTFSEPKLAGDKGYLVYVAAKNVPEDEAMENQKLTISDRLVDPRFGEYGARMFRAWLAKAYEEAEPVRNF